MSSGTLRVGAVLEGPGDHRTISALLRRLLPDKRVDLVGLCATDPFLPWRRVSREARGRVPPRHGHFSGEPAVEDAVTAVLAMRLFHALPERPEAVLLVRDSDGKPVERRNGLVQAREDARWSFTVVIAVPHHMREAWVLAGFSPDNQPEKRLLDAERKLLGFDPTMHPELLDAGDEHAKKSPKRVLARLTSGDVEREDRCIEETPLDGLKERGAAAGLLVFADEVDQRIGAASAAARR